MINRAKAKRLILFQVLWAGVVVATESAQNAEEIFFWSVTNPPAIRELVLELTIESIPPRTHCYQFRLQGTAFWGRVLREPGEAKLPVVEAPSPVCGRWGNFFWCVEPPGSFPKWTIYQGWSAKPGEFQGAAWQVSWPMERWLRTYLAFGVGMGWAPVVSNGLLVVLGDDYSCLAKPVFSNGIPNLVRCRETFPNGASLEVEIEVAGVERAPGGQLLARRLTSRRSDMMLDPEAAKLWEIKCVRLEFGPTNDALPQHLFMEGLELTNRLVAHMILHTNGRDYNMVPRAGGLVPIDISPAHAKRTLADEAQKKPAASLRVAFYCMPVVTFAILALCGRKLLKRQSLTGR